MQLSELAELLLTELYDFAQSKGYEQSIDLQKIAKRFGENDRGKVRQAAKFLENSGYIKAIFTNEGPVLATMTGQGSVFVEKGGRTGVISKYRQDPGAFQISIEHVTIQSVSSSNLAIGSPGATQHIAANQDIRHLLEEIKKALQTDQTLSEAQRTDALADVETLAVQARKEKQDGRIIKLIADGLEKIEKIKPLLSPLVRLLTGETDSTGS